MDLLNVSKSRYTTKAYDPNKKIPQQQFERFLEILRLTPSSINIQPWHFLLQIMMLLNSESLKHWSGNMPTMRLKF